MKKSTALLIPIAVSFVICFMGNNAFEMAVLKINITILTVGYFIVKQLEENKNLKP